MTAPRRYAEGTTVAAAKTRVEIEGFLVKRGASSFGVLTDATVFAVQFQVKARVVRFVIGRPKLDARLPRGRAEKLRDAEERRRWRALLLVLKAKFEAVESGITTFDHEFLAHLVTSAGVTVGDVVGPSLDRALAGDGAALALPARTG